MKAHVHVSLKAGKLKYLHRNLLFAELHVSMILSNVPDVTKQECHKTFFKHTHMHKCPSDYPTPLADCMPYF